MESRHALGRPVVRSPRWMNRFEEREQAGEWVAKLQVMYEHYGIDLMVDVSVPSVSQNLALVASGIEVPVVSMF